MQCVHVDGLCASKPKYTSEETGRYIILKQVEMTLGSFPEILLMGWVGIRYCQLMQFKLRGRACLYSLRAQFIMTR